MAWVRNGALGAALIVAGVVIYQAVEPASILASMMLDAVILPPGAAGVPVLPGASFSQPSAAPACDPLIDEARYWVVPGSPADVAAFLEAHAPSWLPSVGTGTLSNSGGVVNYDVTYEPRGMGFGDPIGLDITVAALPSGLTGMRADAEVIPPSAECTRSGGAASSG